MPNWKNGWKPFGGIFDIETKQQRFAELERLIAEPDFWNDSQAAQKVTRERKTLESILGNWKQLQQTMDDCQVLMELGSEEDAEEEIAGDLEPMITQVERQVTDLEFKKMLGGDHDFNNAYLSINAGAGGTEAQDWANMLLRMYLRWAERAGFKTEIMDILAGEEAGIKSATVAISGDYAFGYLKAEIGIHRLVRISPFDAGARRHTSFASVFVYPEIDDDIDIVVEDKDLRVDTYRASGAGGQHVNKTDSAVRITHLPTNIVVQCQNERSQHMNRATAMKMLKARLYEQELQQREKEVDKMRSEKKQIAWGNQIRSYVLHPYRMVKDHRTDSETGNVDAVLDGDIDHFIQAFLML